MKSFYPNVKYNKSKRRKFLIYFFVTMFLLGGLLTVFIINNPRQFSVVLIGGGMVIICLLLPGVLKAYPTKPKAILEIDEKTITYGGKYTVGLSDIIKAKINVSVDTVSRSKAEILDELNYVAKNLEEEEYFGDVDLIIKGKKKEERLYSTVMDCVGALQALVDFGVKEYEINVFSGKFAVKSNYKFYKTKDQEEVKDGVGLSRKERIKQLL